MEYTGTGRQDKQFSDKLKRAMNSKDVVTFRRLVKGGVNVNAKFWYKSTLLHETTSMGQTEMVRILLKNNADVNATNNDGRTALHLCARSGHGDIAEALIHSGAGLDMQTVDGQTALHVAVWQSKEQVVKQLVAAGADVNLKDRDGWTPLIWAAKSNNMSIVKCLVDKGAKLDCCMKNGMTPVLLAVQNGHLDLARYLVIHGADFHTKSQGQSVLKLLFMNKKLPPASIMAMTDFLMAAGYNIHTERWLKHGSLPTKLTDDIDFTAWLHKCQTNVPSLAMLCRANIRQYIQPRSNRGSICDLPPLLPLPPLLIDFILCRDIG